MTDVIFDETCTKPHKQKSVPATEEKTSHRFVNEVFPFEEDNDDNPRQDSYDSVEVNTLDEDDNHLQESDDTTVRNSLTRDHTPADQTIERRYFFARQETTCNVVCLYKFGLCCRQPANYREGSFEFRLFGTMDSSYERGDQIFGRESNLETYSA